MGYLLCVEYSGNGEWGFLLSAAFLIRLGCGHWTLDIIIISWRLISTSSWHCHPQLQNKCKSLFAGVTCTRRVAVKHCYSPQNNGSRQDYMRVYKVWHIEKQSVQSLSREARAGPKILCLKPLLVAKNEIFLDIDAVNAKRMAI